MDEASGPSRTPGETLRHEHRTISRVLGVLERLVERARRDEGFERESLRKCVDFFRNYADACHHAKEEDLLFPLLESQGIPREGGPIDVMLYEHRVARGLTRAMGDALDAEDGGSEERFCRTARTYVELLRHHISKEDGCLFPMGERCMSAADESDLREKFCEVGCQAFGGRKAEELERMADGLERLWPAGGVEAPVATEHRRASWCNQPWTPE